VRNGARTLREAIGSVLHQEFEDWELVISDNASSDATETILQEFQDRRITVLRQPSPVGMVANHNACLGTARSPWILFLSHDDRLYPQTLSRLFDNIQGEDTLSFGGVRFIRPDGTPQGDYIPSLPRWMERGQYAHISLSGTKNFIHLASCLIRKAALEEVGGLDERSNLFFDWNLYLRLSLMGTCSFLAEPMADYRLGGTSNSLLRESPFSMMKELTGAIERIRGQDDTLDPLLNKAIRRLVIYYAWCAGANRNNLPMEAWSFWTFSKISPGTRARAIFSMLAGWVRGLREGTPLLRGKIGMVQTNESDQRS
jgi:glycosyltransferase involved in cell wall biosynthesis